MVAGPRVTFSLDVALLEPHEVKSLLPYGRRVAASAGRSQLARALLSLSATWFGRKLVAQHQILC